MPLAPSSTNLPTAHQPKISFSIDSIIGVGKGDNEEINSSVPTSPSMHIDKKRNYFATSESSKLTKKANIDNNTSSEMDSSITFHDTVCRNQQFVNNAAWERKTIKNAKTEMSLRDSYSFSPENNRSCDSDDRISFTTTLSSSMTNSNRYDEINGNILDDDGSPSETSSASIQDFGNNTKTTFTQENIPNLATSLRNPSPIEDWEFPAIFSAISSSNNVRVPQPHEMTSRIPNYSPGGLNFASLATALALTKFYTGNSGVQNYAHAHSQHPYYPDHHLKYSVFPWLPTEQPKLFSPHGFNSSGPDLPEFFLQPFRKTKRIRTTFSPAQLLKLEETFKRNRYVVGVERKQLANSLSLSESQIKIWFQNRRTKLKRLEEEAEAAKKFNDYVTNSANDPDVSTESASRNMQEKCDQCDEESPLKMCE